MSQTELMERTLRWIVTIVDTHDQHEVDGYMQAIKAYAEAALKGSNIFGDSEG